MPSMTTARIMLSALSAAVLAGTSCLAVQSAGAATGHGAALPTAGPAYRAFAAEAFSAGAVGVGTTADGEVLLAVDAASASAQTVGALTQGRPNITLIKLTGPPRPTASHEVVGGAGYMVPRATGKDGLCSLAFSAWTPRGTDAFITAGHCGTKGTKAFRSRPSSDVDFTGGETDYDDPAQFKPQRWDELGTFSFSQFGSANDPYGKDEKTATDVGVIDKTNDALTALPAVTEWGADAKAKEDLAASSTLIRSIGRARAGDTVTKSGRTTGASTGRVIGEMVFYVADPVHIMKTRFVKGFMAEHTVRQGDSGGAWFNARGEALGISSASAVGLECPKADYDSCTPGAKDYAFVADLGHALKQTGGYELKLHVDPPRISQPHPPSAPEAVAASVRPGAEAVVASVRPGAAVSGTSEPNASVEFLAAPKEKPSTALARSRASLSSSAGRFSFTAPSAPGTYSYSLVARKGSHSTSAPVSVRITVTSETHSQTHTAPTTER